MFANEEISGKCVRLVCAEKFCYWIKKCKMKLVCCVDTHSSMHIFWFTLLEQLPNGTTGYTFFIEIPDRDTEQTIRVFEVTSSPTGLLLLLFTIVTEAQWQLCHCCRLVVLLVLTKAAACSCAVQMASLHLSSSSASLVRSVDCDVVRLRLTCVEVSFFLWIGFCWIFVCFTWWTCERRRCDVSWLRKLFVQELFAL